MKEQCKTEHHAPSLFLMCPPEKWYLMRPDMSFLKNDVQILVNPSRKVDGNKAKSPHSQQNNQSWNTVKINNPDCVVMSGNPKQLAWHRPQNGFAMSSIPSLKTGRKDFFMGDGPCERRILPVQDLTIFTKNCALDRVPNCLLSDWMRLNWPKSNILSAGSFGSFKKDLQLHKRCKKIIQGQKRFEIILPKQTKGLERSLKR